MERLAHLALDPSFSAGDTWDSRSGVAADEHPPTGSVHDPNEGARPQSFRCGREPRPSDVFIAVMGVTGSGKSSFISLCSGSDDVKIGHGLESCESQQIRPRSKSLMARPFYRHISR